MKHLRIIALMTVLALVSADTFGASWFQRIRTRWMKRHMKEVRHTPPQEPVGAPLDGGLLALLGAAGVAYYGVRKNKKKKES